MFSFLGKVWIAWGTNTFKLCKLVWPIWWWM